MVDTRIVDRVDVENVSAVLHDAVFRPDAIVFDPDTGVFSLKSWVLERVSGENVRRWRAYTLSFYGVLECRAKKREEVSHSELASIVYSESTGTLELVTHYAIDIRLSVGKLDGLLSKTNETREPEKRNRFPWTYSWDNL